MPKLKKVAGNSIFQKFLVRFKDKEVIELTQKALEKGLFPDRNTLINESVRTHLRSVFEVEGGEVAFRQVVKEELKISMGSVKSDLNYLCKSMEFLSIIQNSDDKLLTRFYNLFRQFSENQSGAVDISNAEIESGILDTLPSDLSLQRNELLKKTIK